MVLVNHSFSSLNICRLICSLVPLNKLFNKLSGAAETETLGIFVTSWLPLVLTSLKLYIEYVYHESNGGLVMFALDQLDIEFIVQEMLE